MRLRWRPKLLCVALRQKATCSFLTQRRAKRKAKISGSHGNYSKVEEETTFTGVFKWQGHINRLINVDVGISKHESDFSVFMSRSRGRGSWLRYSETWYKAIPAVFLGSISRENQKVSVLRLFRIQRRGIKLCLVLFTTWYKDLYQVQIPYSETWYKI